MEQRQWEEGVGDFKRVGDLPYQAITETEPVALQRPITTTTS
jgi:hypothetical protein